MPLDRDLMRRIRSLDQFDLRRLLIFVRGLVMAREGLDPDPGRSPARPTVTYRQQLVRCGKPTCTRCPHGPYWYAYWREDGRLRSRYVGKAPLGGPSSPRTGSRAPRT